MHTPRLCWKQHTKGATSLQVIHHCFTHGTGTLFHTFSPSFPLLFRGPAHQSSSCFHISSQHLPATMIKTTLNSAVTVLTQPSPATSPTSLTHISTIHFLSKAPSFWPSGQTVANQSCDQSNPSHTTAGPTPLSRP